MNIAHKPVSLALLGPVVIACALLLSDLAVRCVQAQPQGGVPKVLTAQAFRLTDSQGTTRASLACRPDGSPGLTLLDKSGKSRAAFEMAEGAPSLVLYDAEGKLRARLTVQPDDNVGLALNDKGGTLRATVRLRADGSPTLSLHDADGKARATLETKPDDSTGLLLSNKGDKGGAALVVLPNGNPAAVFKNKDGDLLWAAP
jgi:hypothetical protein